MFRRIRRAIALSIVIAAVAGCTNPVLDAIEAAKGIVFTPAERETLLALPDPTEPFLVGRTWIHPDGSTAPLVCPEPAAPEAHMRMDGTAAMQSFRSVTCYRGWDPALTAAWEPFVYDVVIKESNGCFNVRRAPIFAAGTGWGDSCVDTLVRNRTTEDAGYGQVTYAGWGPRGVVCQRTGLCSAEQIIASPWNSMLAVVVLIEANGRFPWCYSASARAFHRCGLAPP